MSEKKIACCYMVHSDHWFLEESIDSFKGSWPTYVFVSTYPWGGKRGDYTTTREIAQRCGATVIEGIWLTEDEARQFVLAFLAEHGYTHALLPDSDEIIEAKLLQAVVKVAEGQLADRVYVSWDTYWRSPAYVIRPREQFTPIIMVAVNAARHVHLRNYEGGRSLFLGEAYGIIHHLSYAGPDERIFAKVNSWGHKDEVVPNWYENVWLKWPSERMMKNLNPVAPGAYGFTERIAVSALLEASHAKCQANGWDVRQPIEPVKNWVNPSVVIALHNGLEDIDRCLDALEQNRDLIHEVIVVDNGSDADVLDAIRGRNIKLIELGENKGFAYANNRGIEVSTSSILLLLNSDCFITRAGLIRLGNALLESGTIAAVGPLTNRAGHGQQIEPTYTNLANLELFAEDFAARTPVYIPKDMLVGFCMLVRKSVLDEVGSFAEVFGLGTWEDNDLCLRIRMASYRILLVTNSFTHHEGSKTLTRLGIDIPNLLDSNMQIFLDRYKLHFELGFLDALSGMREEPINFDYSRKPETIIAQCKQEAKKRKISACLIVKNEERCIRECIESLLPFFSEIIVNDTGSTDRTLEILREFPEVKVIQNPWADSFSIARNQGIQEATGDFIYWQDADDVLPFASGMKLLDDVAKMPANVGGLIMQVCYSAKSRTPGLKVDHIKLFRNRPEFRFQHRIHEQILPNIQRAGFETRRSDAYIVHENYDESPEGQKRKRERDERLLFLDLADTPLDPFKLFNIGMSYHYWGEHEKALEWFAKSIAHSSGPHSQVGPAFNLWATSLFLLGRIDEAIAKAEEGLTWIPDFAELHFGIGAWKLEQKRFAEAIECFKRVLNADNSHYLTSLDHGIFGYKSMRVLAQAEFGLGNYGAARDLWLQAAAAMPNDLSSTVELASAATEVKDFPTASAMIDRVRDVMGFGNIWVNLSIPFQDAIGGPGSGFRFIAGLLEKNPEYHEVRLTLAEHLIEAGLPNDAVPHLLFLDDRGLPQASYHMGKLCLVSGDMKGALTWMERSQELNPAHIETNETIEKLRLAIAS